MERAGGMPLRRDKKEKIKKEKFKRGHADSDVMEYRKMKGQPDKLNILFPVWAKQEERNRIHGHAIAQCAMRTRC